MAEMGKDSFKRVDYLTPIEKDVLFLVDKKEKINELYGEIYQLKLLGRNDPRLVAEFIGSVMKLYRDLRAKMEKSDIKEDIDDPKNPGQTRPYYVYREAVRVIDTFELAPSKCTLSAALDIYRLILSFIEDSGLLLKNMPRYVV